MITYDFNESEGILYMKVWGIMSLEEMLTRTDHYRKYLKFTRNLRIFEDARQAKAGFDKDGLMLLSKKLRTVVDEFDAIRHAVLHSDPTATAFAMINSNISNSEKYQMMVFSSEKLARDWLDSF